MAKKKPNRKKNPISQKQSKPSNIGFSLQAKLALFCAIFGFLLYANTLNHGFTLDDFSVIEDNYVTKQGFEGIPTLLMTNYRYGYWNSKGTLYRPVSMVMFAIEWGLMPNQSWIHHWVNVLLYALTGFLLFLTLCRYLPRINVLVPFLISLLFIAHPIHVEVVANIKSRDEILGFLFCITTLYFLWDYLEKKQIKHLVFALLAYTLAMFSKENAITFLAVFPLSIYFFRKESVSEILKIAAVFVAPVLLYLAVRFSVLESGIISNVSPLDNLLVASNGLDRMAMAFLLLGKYLYSLLVPHPLVSEIGYPQLTTTTWGNWQSILSLILYLLIGVFALLGWKKKSLLSYGLSFFLVTFSIYTNLFITIGSSYGERFVYMASLGFCIALVSVLLLAFPLNDQKTTSSFMELVKKNSALVGIVSVLVLLYSFKTLSRNADWYDSYALYSADIVKVPNSAKLNYHLGLEEVKQGLDIKDNQQAMRNWLDKGLQHFQKAVELYPKYGDAHAQIGLSLFRRGHLDPALQNYQTALKYIPNDAKVYSNMGIIYFQKNDMQKAEEVYTKAVQLDPRYVDARRNLGSVYAKTKRFDLAIEQFKKAIEYEKDNAILYFYLGSAYRDKGDPAQAKPYFDKAYGLNPALRNQ